MADITLEKISVPRLVCCFVRSAIDVIFPVQLFFGNYVASIMLTAELIEALAVDFWSFRTRSSFTMMRYARIHREATLAEWAPGVCTLMNA